MYNTIIMCVVKGCKRRTIYGYLYLTHCSIHSSLDMSCISRPKCKTCGITAIYGLDSCFFPTHCNKHKTPEMSIVQSVKCLHPGCNKLSSFNKPWRRKGLYCSEHKEPDMHNVVRDFCKKEGCKRYPMRSKTNKSLYCSIHETSNVVKPHNKCVVEGCVKNPSYKCGNETYCVDHKKDGMIKINSKLCLESGCKKLALFGDKNTKVSIYCSIHKKDDMINVVNKLCEEQDCTNLALFGLKSDKILLYCAVHKKDDMVNNTLTICIEDNCKKQATHNFKNFDKAIYCHDHKKDNMISLKFIRCINENCNRRALYSDIYSSKAIYCNIHKNPNMVNRCNKKCEESDCNDLAEYNFTYIGRSKYCKLHKTPEMVYKGKYVCSYDGCSMSASFGVKGGEAPTHCRVHKTYGMANLKKETCKYENCIKSINYRSTLYCRKHMTKTSNVQECIVDGCPKPALFKLRGKTMLYCIDHKTDKMVKGNGRCKHLECEKYASYRYKGSNSSIYCYIHKKPGMILKTFNQCVHDTDVVMTEDNGDEIGFYENTRCLEIPKFNYPGEKTKLYCEAHKLDGMVLVEDAEQDNFDIESDHAECGSEPANDIELQVIEQEVDNNTYEDISLVNPIKPLPEKRKRYIDYDSNDSDYDNDDSDYDCDGDEDYDSDT